MAVKGMPSEVRRRGVDEQWKQEAFTLTEAEADGIRDVVGGGGGTHPTKGDMTSSSGLM